MAGFEYGDAFPWEVRSPDGYWTPKKTLASALALAALLAAGEGEACCAGPAEVWYTDEERVQRLHLTVTVERAS